MAHDSALACGDGSGRNLLHSDEGATDQVRPSGRMTSMAKRVVLAYSGGLDTSVAVRWMIEHMGVEVVCLSADVGQEGTLEGNREKALGAGAIAYEQLDLRAEFAELYVAPVVKANALYEDQYPLVSALSRPLIVAKQVELARRYGADALAHGCTGKGNDQVRFEVSAMALAPDLEMLAPVRNWGFTREDSIRRPRRRCTPSTTTSGAGRSSAVRWRTRGAGHQRACGR
jgi:argininosuccinate synthase